MSIKYKTVKAANLKNTKNEYFIKAVSTETIEKERLIKFISEMCTLTPMDITSMLRALNTVLVHMLTQSRTVHLEGIGYFSIAIESTKPVNPDRHNNIDIRIKGINFKPDRMLIDNIDESIATFEPYKKEVPATELTQEERLINIVNHIQKNGKLNAYEAMEINRCSYRTENVDVRLLKINSLIYVVGSGRYIASDKLIDDNYTFDYQKLLEYQSIEETQL